MKSIMLAAILSFNLPFIRQAPQAPVLAVPPFDHVNKPVAKKVDPEEALKGLEDRLVEQLGKQGAKVLSVKVLRSVASDGVHLIIFTTDKGTAAAEVLWNPSSQAWEGLDVFN